MPTTTIAARIGITSGKFAWPLMGPSEAGTLPFPAWTAGPKLAAFRPNSAWQKLLSLNSIGLNPWCGFSPDTVQVAREKANQNLPLERPFTVRLALKGATGLRWFEVTVSPVFKKGKTLTGWMGVAFETTEDMAKLQELEIEKLQWSYLVGMAENGPMARAMATANLGLPRQPAPAKHRRAAGSEGKKNASPPLGAKVRVSTARTDQAVQAGQAGQIGANRDDWENGLRNIENRLREFEQLSDEVFFRIPIGLKAPTEFVSHPAAHPALNTSGKSSPENSPDWLNLLVSDHRTNVREELRLMTEGIRDSLLVECLLQRGADAKIRNVMIRAALIRDAAGRPLHINGVISDITQRKAAENALQTSEERFQLAVRGSTDGLFDWDVVSNSVYYSPRWKEMLGYDDDEIVGQFKEWENRLHPDDHDRALRHVKEYLGGQRVEYRLEARLRHKDGSYRWILARGILLHDERGLPRRMVGSHVDMTQERELQRNLLEISEQERRIIGYDLHDGLGQELTAVEMLTQALFARTGGSEMPTGRSLVKIGKLVRECISHVRALSRGLAPAATTKSLLDALRELAQSIRKKSKLEVTVTGDDTMDNLPPMVGTQLFRIAEEAIEHARQRPGVSRVELSLLRQQQDVILRIDHDGTTTSLASVTSSNNEWNDGLESMRYRAQLVSAELMRHPLPGGGTRITCQITLSNENTTTNAC